MSNSEYACLCLSNKFGISDAKNISCTWNNINIRTLLGPMYDKYDTFVLSLESIMQSESTEDVGATFDDEMVLVQMSGLPFLNATFNITTGINNSSTILVPFRIPSEATNFSTFDNVFRIFGKSADLINITIGFIRYNFNTVSTSILNPYPNMTYIFNIKGITKEKGNLNNTRMIR
jgi:hypothetical protein